MSSSQSLRKDVAAKALIMILATWVEIDIDFNVFVRACEEAYAMRKVAQRLSHHRLWSRLDKTILLNS